MTLKNTLSLAALSAEIRADLEENWPVLRDQYIDQRKDKPTYGMVRHDMSGDIGASSEHQGFGLMGAHMFNDGELFDAILGYAKTNLQVMPDGRKGFYWRKDSNGSVRPGTASDGEVSIAEALLLRYKQTRKASYLADALEILNFLKTEIVVSIAGRKFIAAAANNTPGVGDFWDPAKGLACFSNYWMASAFRLFQEFDPTGPWADVLGNQYGILAQARALYSHGHVPEGFRVDFTTGQVKPWDANAVPYASTATAGGYRWLTWALRDAFAGGPESLDYLADYNALLDAYRNNGDDVRWGFHLTQTWGAGCWPLACLVVGQKVLAGDIDGARNAYRDDVRRYDAGTGLWDFNSAACFHQFCALIALATVAGLD